MPFYNGTVYLCFLLYASYDDRCCGIRRYARPLVSSCFTSKMLSRSCTIPTALKPAKRMSQHRPKADRESHYVVGATANRKSPHHIRKHQVGASPKRRHQIAKPFNTSTASYSHIIAKPENASSKLEAPHREHHHHVGEVSPNGDLSLPKDSPPSRGLTKSDHSTSESLPITSTSLYQNGDTKDRI